MNLIESIFGPLLEAIKAEARSVLLGLEADAKRAIDRIMRAVRYALAEVTLWLFAGVFLLAGVLVFLMRFFPADAVLVGTAFLLSYVALLVRMMR